MTESSAKKSAAGSGENTEYVKQNNNMYDESLFCFRCQLYSVNRLPHQHRKDLPSLIYVSQVFTGIYKFTSITV